MFRKHITVSSTQLVAVSCVAYLVLYAFVLVSPSSIKDVARSDATSPSALVEAAHSKTLEGGIPLNEIKPGYSTPKPNTFFKDPGKKANAVKTVENPTTSLAGKAHNIHSDTNYYSLSRTNNTRGRIISSSQSLSGNGLVIRDRLTAYLANPSGDRDDKGNRKVGHQQSSRYQRLKRTLLPELNARDSVSRSGNMARLARNNFTLKESKIAAIFRGVAYGIPTENPATGYGVIKLPMNIFKKPAFDDVSKDRGIKPTLSRPAGAVGDTPLGKSPRGRIQDIPGHSLDGGIDGALEETQIEYDHLNSLPHLVVENGATKRKNVDENVDNKDFKNSITDNNIMVHRTEETYNVVDAETKFTTEPTKLSGASDLENLNSNDVRMKDSEVIVISYDLQNRSSLESWDSVKRTLGLAWPIHIHTATCVFGILTVISIYQLSRGKVWHDVSPGLFVIFYISIIAATSLRSASYFLDAFGAEGRLPVVLTMILWNMSSPIILSVLAIFLLVLLKTSNSSLSIMRSVIILCVCLLHVLLCLVLEISPEVVPRKWLHLQLQIYQQIFTATWGFIVSIAYTILLNRIERQYSTHHKVAEPIVPSLPPPRLRRAARISIFAAGCHIILSGIIIICLVMPEQPPLSVRSINVWMWFTQQCIARFFEVMLCICLLFASCALVHCKQGDCPPAQRSSLCSLFTKCCVNGASGVHPASKRTQPLAIFTLNKHRSSFDYVTNDFQLVWNKSRSNDSNGDSSREPNDQENITYLRPATRNLPPMKFLASSSRSTDSIFTPSPDEYFSSPLSKSTTGLYDNIQIEQVSNGTAQGLQPYLPCKGFYVNNYKYIGATLPNRLGNGSGGANDRRSPSCNPAESLAGPGFGSSYWSPLVPSPRIRQHDLISDERESERSGAGNSHSADYLSSVVSANNRSAGAHPSSAFRIYCSASVGGIHVDDVLQSPCRYSQQHSSIDAVSTRECNAPFTAPTAFSNSANTLCRRNDPEKDIRISSSSRTTSADVTGRWKPVHTLPLRLSSPRRKKSARNCEGLTQTRNMISE